MAPLTALLKDNPDVSVRSQFEVPSLMAIAVYRSAG